MTRSTRYASAITTVVSPTGRPFNVRLVHEGERYGRDGVLTHDEPDPLIEFYDGARAGDWPDAFSGNLGQFVSRYYLSTLAETTWWGDGLCLDGGVPEWTVAGDSLARALNMIKEVAA